MEGWAGFSNFGPWVNLAAPGDNIYTLGHEMAYVSQTGTRMSAAMVAGAAVLALAAQGGKGSIAPDKLRDYLLASVDEKPWLTTPPRVASGVSTILSGGAHSCKRLIEPCIKARSEGVH